VGNSWPLAGANYTVPANTNLGIELVRSNSVTVAASEPIRLGGIFGAFLTSATFSGNSYADVHGAVAIGGQALGSPNTSSNYLTNKFNQSSQALDLGSMALNAMKILHSIVNCETIFGGKP